MHPLLKKLWALVAAYLDVLATAGVIGGVAAYALSFRLPVVSYLSLTDSSTFLDFVAKAQHGTWLGRDVLFTYGPLMQWIMSRVPLLYGASFGGSLETMPLLPTLLGILLLFGTGRLLLRGRQPWERAFFLLLLGLFWMPVDLKMLLPLFSFSVFLALAETMPEKMRHLAPRAVLATGLLIVNFLISADAGIYAAGAFVLTTLVFQFPLGIARSKAWGKYLAFTLLFGFAAILAVNAFMGRVSSFAYWRDSFRVAEQYRWSAALGMNGGLEAKLWWVLGASLVIFATAFYLQGKTEQAGRRRVLMAMLLVGMMFLQTTLVRSEWLHIALGTFPLLTFDTAILCGAVADAGKNMRITMLLALLVTALFAGSNREIPSPEWRLAHAAPLVDGRCPGDRQDFEDVCFTNFESAPLAAIRDAIDANTSQKDELVVFPFENMYGFLSHRTVAGGVLQNYAVSGDFMVRRQLQGLEREKPQAGLYLEDTLASWAMDGVPSFTRSPEIWLYMQRWYRAVAKPSAGVLVLQRDEERAQHWQMHEAALQVELGEYVPAPGRPLELAPRWPGGDFVKLRLRAEYPFYWRFLKPAQLTVELKYMDGSEKTVKALAEPNRDYDVWIDPADDTGLLQYFSASDARWHDPAMPALRTISIMFTPLDRYSVMPRKLFLEKAEAVTVELK